MRQIRRQLKVGLIWSVLVALGVFTVLVVVKPTQPTKWEDKHAPRNRSGLLMTTAQTPAPVHRPQNQFPSRLYLTRVRMYAEAERYLKNVPHNTTHRQELDIMKVRIYEPDAEFTSPCRWVEHVPENNCPDAEAPLKKALTWSSPERGKILRCLPYFFLAGVNKCGTSTLFFRIQKHPDVTPHAIKETKWINRHRLFPFCSSIETYLDYLQLTSSFIQSKYRQGEVSPYVIGDGTPSYLSTNDFWDMMPGNEGCKEPCVTNADIIHHLNPRARLIIILRNPTTRLYSSYFQKAKLYRSKVSKQGFHDLVVKEIANFKTCLTSQSFRGCCYNYSLSNSFTEALDVRRGIYHVFMSDWMKLFPRDQIHVIKFEDYIKNEKTHLAEIFKFLKLRNLSDEDLENIANMKPANQRHYGAEVGDMLNSTRDLIDRFYKPHNDEFSILMKNKYWNW
ncbi:carbohydrate sulfotransferase 15-like [Haliotis rufescens]|uniref:carbohydrate sulfotransferase 15-like n=1 Tax=Haliotis rufescens TaxID=6454 RepID=UPI00201EC55D|nr:carbohydrate sulfotransferase 15-like [Haliotis rufescens]